jgi:hypothetical protein
MQEMIEESEYNPKDSFLGSKIDMSDSPDNSPLGGAVGYTPVGGDSSRFGDF